jgi:hypothetical protein
MHDKIAIAASDYELDSNGDNPLAFGSNCTIIDMLNQKKNLVYQKWYVKSKLMKANDERFPIC